MFKKDFTAGSKTKVKSSAQRAIRAKVVETYPRLEPHIDEILPKKEQLDLVKLPDRVSLYSLGNEGLFWQHMNDPIIPHLKVIHRYPWAFQRLRIDRGAIRFVLSGATLMVPGLTSPGGRLPGTAEDSEVYGNGGTDIAAGEVVVVEAEGKENACMVGVLKMGTKEMKEKKKGPGIENGHYVGDGLWKLDLS
ncbi:translation machinery-associated protein 20 [Recurvomyces mirabilis]|uniref:Translation machinery-associated protein 20 n=1 Tax=Recurvomyces mirabilis TaxID=574656 RepID=A0AAE0TU83_9PEZI|nr:translation machinery-associated protein 20 [Recurvomyces mirabilis]KAK5159792.1 translation machinery-associated protein 20 [Recurvomyces mirabilis]